MSEFLDEQYVMPSAVFPPVGVDVARLPPAVPGAAVPPPPPAPARGVVPVFDTRPVNAQDIYREFTNNINFTVPQGFTFILRRVKAASYKDIGMTVPVAIESGLRLSVTVNGINTLLTDPNYGFASNFDAPVFITIPETQILGGSVAANGPLLPGTFNIWQPVNPNPPGNVTWAANIEGSGASIIIGQGTVNGLVTLDGLNFSAIVLPNTAGDIAYTNGAWLAASWGTNQVFVSLNNGATWTTYAFPNNIGAVAGGNGMFVGWSPIAGKMFLSLNNGQSWNAGTALPGLSGGIQTIIWDGAQFVARTGTGAQLQIWTSPDGVAWTLKSQIAQVGGSSFSLAFGNGAYIVDNGGTLYRSTDLVNWVNVLGVINLPVATTGRGVSYANGIWRTCLTNVANTNWVSTDNGLTWSSQYIPLVSAGTNTVGHIDGVFYEFSGNNTAYALVVQNAQQAAQGGLTMKFAIEGQLIPNNAMPANTAARG